MYASFILVIIDSVIIVGILLMFLTTEITLPNKLKSLLFYVQVSVHLFAK